MTATVEVSTLRHIGLWHVAPSVDNSDAYCRVEHTSILAPPLRTGIPTVQVNTLQHIGLHMLPPPLTPTVEGSTL